MLHFLKCLIVLLGIFIMRVASAADPHDIPDFNSFESSYISDEEIGERFFDERDDLLIAESELEYAPLFPEDDIEALVESWRTAWSQQDVAAYTAHYCEDYSPKSSVSHALWLEQRERILNLPSYISITLNNVTLHEVKPTYFTVTFEQDYQSSTINDISKKQLGILFDGERWKIVKETSL